MLKKIFIILFLFLSLFFGIKVFSSPIEQNFSDINDDYIYYNELQTLYDKGIIKPDADGKFNPDRILKRDELVGIAVELSCTKCILPDTDINLLNNFSNQKPFFDIGLSNKNFYCISKAKYDNNIDGTICSDGTNIDGESLFCPNNDVTREEALSTIMRIGGIMSSSEANVIISRIRDGESFPDLSNDVKPKNSNGTVNIYYPYFKKALDYKVIDFDLDGNEKIYKLIEIKNNSLYPGQVITREDFLKMAFVVYKGNSCINTNTNKLALKINVYNKDCNLEKFENHLCYLSNLNDNTNIFDFTNEVDGVCDLGIDDNNGYVWDFYNLTNGDHINLSGKYIDNYEFSNSGIYKIFLTVNDKCGNKSIAYMQMSIGLNNQLSSYIKADKIIGSVPLSVSFISIVNGGIGTKTYNWILGDGSTRINNNFTHMFMQEGVYTVKLNVNDGDKNTESLLNIKVLPNKCNVDTDGDGIGDCDDKCLTFKGKEENDGCPIFLPRLSTLGNIGDCLAKQDIPSFIFGNINCNTCPCEKTINFRATLRNCDIVIPAITSPDEKELYSKGNFYQLNEK